MARVLREGVQAAASPAPAATPQAAASSAAAKSSGKEEGKAKPESTEVICLDSDEDERSSKKAKNCTRASAAAKQPASTLASPEKGVVVVGDKRQWKEPAGTEERKRKEIARHGQHHQGSSQKGADLTLMSSGRHEVLQGDLGAESCPLGVDNADGACISTQLLRSAQPSPREPSLSPPPSSQGHGMMRVNSHTVPAVFAGRPPMIDMEVEGSSSACSFSMTTRKQQPAECEAGEARDRRAATGWLDWLSSQNNPPDAATAAAQMLFCIYAK